MKLLTRYIDFYTIHLFHRNSEGERLSIPTRRYTFDAKIITPQFFLSPLDYSHSLYKILLNAGGATNKFFNTGKRTERTINLHKIILKLTFSRRLIIDCC